MAFLAQGILKGLSAVAIFMTASSASPPAEDIEPGALTTPLNPPKPTPVSASPVIKKVAPSPALQETLPPEPNDLVKEAVEALRSDFLHRVATGRQTMFNTCFTRTNAPVDPAGVALVRGNSQRMMNVSMESHTVDYSGQPIVVLDAGHGGGEPGASREGVVEKDVVYAVTQKLKAALEKNDIYVVETRGRSLSSAYRFKDQPFALQWRAELSHMLATTFADRPVLFLSLHADSSPSPDSAGASVFFYNGNSYDSPSGQFARALAARYRSPFGVELKKDDFAVLRCQDENTPAVLLELGFLTHDAEREYLVSLTRNSSVSSRAIDQIATGIRSFIEKKREEQKPDDPVVIADARPAGSRTLTP